MTRLIFSTGARLAAVALTATGALALTACEEHGYPSAAPREATAAPPPDDAALAGAPTDAGGYQAAPTTRSPSVYPPADGVGPGYPPPVYAQRGDRRPGYAPPPAAYPPGYGHRDAGGAPPEIVTMAPIPNPPERPLSHGAAYGRRHAHHRLYAYGPPAYAAPAFAHHPHHSFRRFAAAPYGGAHRLHPDRHVLAAAAPLHRHSATVGPMHPAPARSPAPAAPAGPQLTKPQGLDHHRHHHHGAETAAASAASTSAMSPSNTARTPNATADAPSGGEAANTTAAASEADRYKTLEQALRDLFANAAQLSAPSHMEANQPSTVTLTLPADFAQAARTEAAKENLSAAVASMNLVATLSGDGYAIVPAEAQSLPLTLGAPTIFQWKVTPAGSGRGALRASMRADGAVDGHSLALGEKTAGSGSATGRLVGVGLLALIALVLLGWAAQRRRPAAAGATKPRASHTNGLA